MNATKESLALAWNDAEWRPRKIAYMNALSRCHGAYLVLYAAMRVLAESIGYDPVELMVTDHALSDQMDDCRALHAKLVSSDCDALRLESLTVLSKCRDRGKLAEMPMTIKIMKEALSNINRETVQLEAIRWEWNLAATRLSQGRKAPC